MCWTFPVTHRNFCLARAARRKSTIVIWMYLYRYIDHRGAKVMQKARVATSHADYASLRKLRYIYLFARRTGFCVEEAIYQWHDFFNALI